MKPYPARDVPERVWTVFHTICEIVSGLPADIAVPTFILGIRVSAELIEQPARIVPNCHDFAEAFARLLEVDAHHGWINTTDAKGGVRKLSHAWLTVRGQDSKFIIDPWPLGVMTGPALFLQDYAFHFGSEMSLVLDDEGESRIAALVSAMHDSLGAK